MNKPITEEDFTDLRDQLYPNMTDRACERYFELAKRMAIDFEEWIFKSRWFRSGNQWVQANPYPAHMQDSKTTEQLFELYQQQKQ